MSSFVENLINIHLFAEVQTEMEAMMVNQRLSDMLRCFGSLQTCLVKKYWKMPEYFEFTIQVADSSNSSDKVNEITAMLGKGWVRSGSTVLWHNTAGSAFVDSSIRWASVELIEVV